MGARSKGCHTCKARKVRCDGTRPSCNRCGKLGNVCPGYENTFNTFIDGKPRIERAQAVARKQERESSGMQKNALYRSSHIRTPTRTPCCKVPRPSTEISLVAFKDGILLSFLVNKLQSGYSHCERLAAGSKTGPPLINPCSPRGTWIWEIAKSPNNSLGALSAMFFGEAHNLRDMITSSLRLYGCALADMQKKISEARSVLDFETMASMTSLCMFELATCRTESGWLQHADAMEQMLKLRGPWRQKTVLEKSLFVEQRVILASNTFLRQKKTILSQPLWNTVPWEDDPSSKKAFDVIVDISSDIASHLADLTCLAQGDTLPARQHLATRVMNSVLELNSWWRRWIIDNPRLCREVKLNPKTTVTVDADGPLFETILLFNTLWDAYTLCSYDCARLFLLHILRSLAPAHEDFSTINRYPDGFVLDEQNNTPLLGITSDMIALGQELLRSFDYCYAYSGGFMGSFCVVTVLDAEFGALMPGSREANWVLEMNKR